MYIKKTLILVVMAGLLSACNLLPEGSSKLKSESETPKNISFLAFGDGGYSIDYPKKKHLEKALNKSQFLKDELKDWLEDGRPESEFDHAPITVFNGTDIATEQSGALPVGLAMASFCQQRQCDFAIQLGDNVYPAGADDDDGKDDEKRMNDLILEPVKPLLKIKPDLTIYSSLGNHDWKSSRKGVQLQTDWMTRQPNFNMDPQGYYSYRYGQPGYDIEFFVLDTNMLLSGQNFYDLPLNPDGSEQNLEEALKTNNAELEEHMHHEQPLHGEDKTQLEWLKKGIKNSSAKWKIVYGHHILWSIGGTKYSEGHVLRKLLLPTLCEYADAYIAGHEHDLELLTDDCSKHRADKQVKPLPLIISGAASKMRGTHTPFAAMQEKRYPEYELIWAKSFVWGFANIEINHQADKFSVEFFTTPKDGSGELITEKKFEFSHRSPVN